jgi:hypothetical protein
LRRFPVFGFTLREYSRYSPDWSFLIMFSQTRAGGFRCPTRELANNDPVAATPPCWLAMREN